MVQEQEWCDWESRLTYKYRRRTQTITPQLQERYIREDVGCGILGCPHCPIPPPTCASLPAQPPFIALPDGPALRQWLEVWELPDVRNWVVTRGALHQFSLKAGLRQSTRLRALYRDKRRAVALFDDLHCAWTAHSTEPVPCGAASFYVGHVHPARPPVVVVSDRLAGVTTPVHVLALAERLQGVDPATSAPGGGSTSAGSGDVSTTTAGMSSQSASTVPSSITTTTTSTVTRAPPGFAPLSQTTVSPAGVPTLLSQTTVNGLPWPPRPRRPPYLILPVAEFFLTVFRDCPAVVELASSVLASQVSKAQAAMTAGGAGGVAPGEEGAGKLGASTAEWQDRRFMAQHEIEQGLEEGTLLQGKVIMSTRSPDAGLVQLGAGGGDVQLGAVLRLSGRAALGRAMHGDTVAVRILPAPLSARASGDGADVARPDPEPRASAVHTPGSLTAAGDGTGTVDSGPTAEHAGDADVASRAAHSELQLLGLGEANDAAVADVEGAAEGGEVEDDATSALARQGGLAALPLCEVVGVLSRGGRTLVATLSPADEQALRTKAERDEGLQLRTEAVLVVPYDRRFPLLRVRSRAAARLLGQRLVVQVDDWPRGARYPDAHVVRVLGPANDLDAERQAVLEQSGIRWQPFCDGALAELPAVPGGDPRAWRPTPEERSARRDLTTPEYFVCSIDPVGCTDVDDAMHVRHVGAGRVEVGVHIADVSYFVRPGSLLDQEARDRCTSVYLVDKRLDMLPSLLSEQVCSLLEGVDRYAVSVVWTLQAPTDNGRGPLPGKSERQVDGYQVVGTWFGRTVIRSRHQLHYQQAQDLLDGRPPAPGDALPAASTAALLPALRTLKRLTDQWRAARLADGAVELESLELRFKTDTSPGGVAGAPTAVVPKPKIPMMDVVAEMMIGANAAVARRVCDAFPAAALLRCHPPPRQQALEQFQELLSSTLPGALPPRDPSSPGGATTFARDLARACRSATRRDAAAAALLKGLAVRAMSEAQYVSTGVAPPGTPASYHYGLALQYYTHFTSPIRRYADVVVHRQLLAALQAAHSPATAPAPLPLSDQTPTSAPVQASTGTPPDARAAEAPASSIPVDPALALLPPPPPPPVAPAELTAAAERMNSQHRAAKAAQTKCTELYLLLLLHKHPHVEAGLITSIAEDGWLEVFVPRLQLRARTRVWDPVRGVLRLPLTGDPAQDEALVAGESDVFALQARQQQYAYRPQSDGQAVDILDVQAGHVVWRAQAWGRTWVQLSAAGSSLHGPRLEVRLVSDTHPQAAAQRAQQPQYDGEAAKHAGKEQQERAAVGQAEGDTRASTVALQQHAPGTAPSVVEAAQASPSSAQRAPPSRQAPAPAPDEAVDVIEVARVAVLSSQAQLPVLPLAAPTARGTGGDAHTAQQREQVARARQLAARVARCEAKLAHARLSSTSRKAKWTAKLDDLQRQLSAAMRLE